MHGRLKVKTTAEQAEQKRKEREKKRKAFQKASDLALGKIERKEYDVTGLEVTQQLLSANSDLSSMWNYRKFVFRSMHDKPEEERKKLCLEELAFLASCLRNNPKSYGCWHHRCFIVLSMPEPNWKKELELCDQFLQFDDRNFHCWDYRRFVVKNSILEVSIDSEIKFTVKLVENNFSNYSSWHYRSKLLPVRYPSSKQYEQIEEKKLLEELEFVQNAFFTDPNDQSAWFYHRWLLGRGEKAQKMVAAHIWRTSSSITCIFRKPISHKELQSHSSVTIGDKTQDGVWQPLNPDSDKYQFGWVFKVANTFPDKEMILSLTVFDKTTQIRLDSDAVENYMTEFTGDEFRQELSDGKELVLRSELGSCIELNDLEPGNKWVVLTLVHLMCAIDAQKYKVEIKNYLNDLQEIDPMRRSHYSDLLSKVQIEGKVTNNLATQSILNLSNVGLTRLCHLQYFSTIKTLDISSNTLQKLSEPFHLLLCCEEICADNNTIEDISGVKNMPKLVKLSLSGNCLRGEKDFCTLSSCPSLKILDITDNGVKDPDGIKALLPEVETGS